MGLCLLPGKARKLLPEPFGSLDLEHDPDVGPIFRNNNEAMVNHPEMLTLYLNAVETFARKVADEKPLDEAAKHLMSLHLPTAFMDRGNPLLKSYSPTELAKFFYHPPKMPAEGGPFEILSDAPHSNRTVAAVNLTKQKHGNWFHFPGPYMQTRKMGTFRMFRRLFHK